MTTSLASVPRVRAFAEEDNGTRWVLHCPYCGQVHRHATGAGVRLALCNPPHERGTHYVVLAPISADPVSADW